MKHLYDSLRGCAKEEEVKAEFCKFFRMKIFALRGIDHYTERVLFEFKYDRNFRNPENVARVLAQVMYYARLLKFGTGLTKYPLPPYICVVDKNEAFFAETKDYAKFYAAKGDRYDWDRAPSTPCPKLVEDIFGFLTQRHRDTEKSGNEGLLSLRGDSEARSLGEDSRKTPDLQNSKTPSSKSNESSESLSLCVKNNPAQSLRLAHDTLRAKLLPQIYSLGFLNPDVEYFE